MAQNRLPSGNIVDSVTNLSILYNLKTNFVEQFSQIDGESCDAVWPNKMKITTLVDQNRVLIM